MFPTLPIAINLSSQKKDHPHLKKRSIDYRLLIDVSNPANSYQSIITKKRSPTPPCTPLHAAVYACRLYEVLILLAVYLFLQLEKPEAFQYCSKILKHYTCTFISDRSVVEWIEHLLIKR